MSPGPGRDATATPTSTTATTIAAAAAASRGTAKPAPGKPGHKVRVTANETVAGLTSGRLAIRFRRKGEWRVEFTAEGKTLTASDTAVTSGTLTLAAGRASLLLAAPASGHVGSVDVALSLGSTAIDASCLQPWTLALGDAASAGATLAYLRSAWCGATLSQDPSARASFGLYKGADNLLYQRENY